MVRASLIYVIIEKRELELELENQERSCQVLYPPFG